MPDPIDDDGPFTFINVFDIAEDEIDTFIKEWKQRSELMITADGFISAELHRAIDSDTHFKLINVAKYESLAQFEAATHDPKYRANLEKYASASTWKAHRGFYRTAAKFD
ncbi:antibiotic biosynthesis monooxygenase family protein [Subtercola lobariae]|uniref:ABM domain-containing protein n=1 Tax=Subtercola lobariae TaxID=1588641 RepID=A0A917EWP8_9MICO|nr:antibiotic biosynthesis monooxygenase family protein [Subtercola lobariae]GGF22769.1 hypothetical protein GCM10011399_15520 [Subtercola lobariae]